MVQGKNSIWGQIAVYTFLSLFIAMILYPFLMVISISLSAGNSGTGGSLFPTNFSLEHWKYVLGIGGSGSLVLRWFLNSIIVATVSSLMILIFSGSGAYAFSRLPFKGKAPLLTSLMILQMFPQVLSLVAIYTILNAIGNFFPALGLNTHAGLILVYMGGVAIYIWMIKGYFDTIPQSIEESAMIDGATTFQTFWQILLPMSLPIFAVVFILSFITFIGEYPVASQLLTKESNWTLAVGAKSFLYDQHYEWGNFAATAVLTGIPISLMFLFSQKFLISGMTAGGVKE